MNHPAFKSEDVNRWLAQQNANKARITSRRSRHTQKQRKLLIEQLGSDVEVRLERLDLSPNVKFYNLERGELSVQSNGPDQPCEDSMSADIINDDEDDIALIELAGRNKKQVKFLDIPEDTGEYKSPEKTEKSPCRRFSLDSELNGSSSKAFETKNEVESSVDYAREEPAREEPARVEPAREEPATEQKNEIQLNPIVSSERKVEEEEVTHCQKRWTFKIAVPRLHLDKTIKVSLDLGDNSNAENNIDLPCIKGSVSLVPKPPSLTAPKRGRGRKKNPIHGGDIQAGLNYLLNDENENAARFLENINNNINDNYNTGQAYVPKPKKPPTTRKYNRKSKKNVEEDNKNTLARYVESFSNEYGTLESIMPSNSLTPTSSEHMVSTTNPNLEDVQPVSIDHNWLNGQQLQIQPPGASSMELSVPNFVFNNNGQLVQDNTQTASTIAIPNMPLVRPDVNQVFPSVFPTSNGLVTAIPITYFSYPNFDPNVATVNPSLNFNNNLPIQNLNVYFENENVGQQVSHTNKKSFQSILQDGVLDLSVKSSLAHEPMPAHLHMNVTNREKNVSEEISKMENDEDICNLPIDLSKQSIANDKFIQDIIQDIPENSKGEQQEPENFSYEKEMASYEAALDMPRIDVDDVHNDFANEVLNAEPAHKLKETPNKSQFDTAEVGFDIETSDDSLKRFFEKCFKETNKPEILEETVPKLSSECDGYNEMDVDLDFDTTFLADSYDDFSNHSQPIDIRTNIESTNDDQKDAKQSSDTTLKEPIKIISVENVQITLVDPKQTENRKNSIEKSAENAINFSKSSFAKETTPTKINTSNKDPENESRTSTNDHKKVSLNGSQSNEHKNQNVPVPFDPFCKLDLDGIDESSQPEPSRKKQKKNTENVIDLSKNTIAKEKDAPMKMYTSVVDIENESQTSSYMQQKGESNVNHQYKHHKNENVPPNGSQYKQHKNENVPVPFDPFCHIDLDMIDDIDEPGTSRGNQKNITGTIIDLSKTSLAKETDTPMKITSAASSQSASKTTAHSQNETNRIKSQYEHRKNENVPAIFDPFCHVDLDMIDERNEPGPSRNNQKYFSETEVSIENTLKSLSVLEEELTQEGELLDFDDNLDSISLATSCFDSEEEADPANPKNAVKSVFTNKQQQTPEVKETQNIKIPHSRITYNNEDNKKQLPPKLISRTFSTDTTIVPSTSKRLNLKGIKSTISNDARSTSLDSSISELNKRFVIPKKVSTNSSSSDVNSVDDDLFPHGPQRVVRPLVDLNIPHFIEPSIVNNCFDSDEIIPDSDFQFEESSPVSTRTETIETMQIFGVTCFRFLVDQCSNTLCEYSHSYKDSTSVKNILNSLTPEKFQMAYNFMYRHANLFKRYFSTFCMIYMINNHRSKLLNLINDCERYEPCGENLRHIYQCLLRSGFNKVNACRQLLKRSKNRSINAIDNLLEIILECGWIHFAPYIEEFVNIPHYFFHVPTLERMALEALQNPSISFAKIIFKCLLRAYVEEIVLIKQSPILCSIVEKVHAYDSRN